MRWFLVFLLAMIVFNSLRPWLQKIGLGRLPGDLHFRFRGKEWYFPFGSSLVLSGLAFGIGLLI
jgi:hypothetical protein